MLSKRDLYKNPISHFKCSISKYRILFLQVHDTRPNFAWFAPSQSVSHKSCSHVKHQVPKLHLHQTPGAQSAQCMSVVISAQLISHTHTGHTGNLWYHPLTTVLYQYCVIHIWSRCQQLYCEKMLSNLVTIVYLLMLRGVKYLAADMDSQEIGQCSNHHISAALENIQVCKPRPVIIQLPWPNNTQVHQVRSCS